MRREDILSILVKLKFVSDDFPTVVTTFLYEFSDRNYEIKYEREAGRVVNFQVTDKGAVAHEVR